MRVLVITKIFPNRYNPSYAGYNRHQFRELSRLCDVELLALWPAYPGSALLDALRGGRPPAPPLHETIDGLHVEHPRVLYIPKIGQATNGASYALSLLPQVWPRRHRIDLILGAFAYPDGWAAVALGKALRVPVVVKLHGSDINEVRKKRLLRPGLRFALRSAQRVVANNQKLLDSAVSLGASPLRTRLVPNGIDKTVFFPRSKSEARAALGLPAERRRISYVGRVVASKGLRELLDAFAQISARDNNIALDIVGEGSFRRELQERARARNLAVVFHGDRNAEQVAQHLAAADVVTLPSYAEGMPNSVLEAMACGRPVVATRVGGIPAMMQHPSQGELVPPKDADALAASLQRVLAAGRSADEVAGACALPDWGQSAASLYQSLVEARREHRR